MSEGPHDHARPDVSAQRAALVVARAILTGADADAHQAAATASCPACVAMAGTSFGSTLASMMAGDQALMSEQTRARLLAAIDAAQAELDAFPN